MPYKGVAWVLTEEQISDKFMKAIDVNKDGMLSKEELKRAFEELGSRYPAWRAGRALSRADANNDGHISLDEIKELVAYVHDQKYKI